MYGTNQLIKLFLLCQHILLTLCSIKSAVSQRNIQKSRINIHKISILTNDNNSYIVFFKATISFSSCMKYFVFQKTYFFLILLCSSSMTNADNSIIFENSSIITSTFLSIAAVVLISEPLTYYALSLTVISQAKKIKFSKIL